MKFHGRMTSNGDGRAAPTEFVVPTQVLRSRPDETGFVYHSSSNGNTMIGIRGCNTYAEYLVDYADDEMCTVIEVAVEITAEGGNKITYVAGETFYMAKGFTGLWESHGHFKKYFMIAA